MKFIKSVLRYPGSKQKAVPVLSKYFPLLNGNRFIPNFDHYYEPFLGGGAVALYITQAYPHKKVIVNDLYKPLYCFWITLQRNLPEFIQLIETNFLTIKSYEQSKTFFDLQYEVLESSSDSIELAFAFYCLNRISFSGLIHKSSLSSTGYQNITPKIIPKLKKCSKIIQKWVILNQSYDELDYLSTPNNFIYLDPPYFIKDNLYGENGNIHKSFDHSLFYDFCKKLAHQQLLISYNTHDHINNQKISDNFPNFQSDTFDLTYIMNRSPSYLNDQKNRKELLIYNYPVFVSRGETRTKLVFQTA